MRVFLLCWLVLGWGTVSARPNGHIEGTVRGEGGEALPGANVVVTGVDVGELTRAATGDEGRFRFAVPPGNYRIEISFIGYRSEIRENVTVQPGRSTTLDVILAEQVIFMEKSVVSASRRREKILDAPASVSVVETADIRNNPSMNVADHVKNLPSVDFAKTGLANSSIVVRGFNSVFTGTLLMMTDNRLARVPSVRVNAPNFIPITSDDVERIEVVLGPGSALYGPNSADGVMHIITHSPFTSQGTSAHFGYGERNLRQASIRHAGKVGDRVGYKISARYYTGTEWEYIDPEEVRARERREEQIAAGLNLPSLPLRNPETNNLGLEARLDWRASDDFTAIFSAGHNKADLVGLTGVGASQTRDWQYNYAQMRVLYGDWFVQAFRNWTDSGGTFLLRTGDPVVDKSSLTVFQAQHLFKLGGRQRFTYGLDALFTRPDTEETVMGRNEDDDDLNEFGVYLQSETSLSGMVDLVLALRYDYHSRLADPEFSPRAALVLKPKPTQTWRLTYNRAFTTPTSNNLYLDLLATRDPFGFSGIFSPMFTARGLTFNPIDLWTQGNYQDNDFGFTFRREGGRPLFRSPFASMAGLPADQYLRLDDPEFTNVMWGIGRDVVLEQLLPTVREMAVDILIQQGMGAEEARAVANGLAEAFPAVVPQRLTGLRNAMGRLNIATPPLGENQEDIQQPFFFVESDGATPVTAYDVPRIQSAITRTIEFGYKGVIADKLIVAADLYHSRIENYVGSVSVETPNVFLEPESLAEALSRGFEQTLSDPSNALLAAGLQMVDNVQVPGLLEGNGNGSPVDELTAIFVAGAAAIPYGTVSPEQASDPYAMVLTYRNYEDITIRGLDLGLAWYPTAQWRLSGNYSYVSKNFFKNLKYTHVPGVGDITLNSPRHKFKLGASYDFSGLGLSVGSALRFTDSFPMQSGVYVGDVDAYTVVDMSVKYRLPVERDVDLHLDASNLLNTRYRSFIGAPEVGRLVFSQISMRF
ncbi:MAG: TonB-dependent receptor [Gemmatimonadota bacterium]|nr:TonB-dependent receptor [Gemmatimonadota bacterium]